ncbi:MAG: tRNA (guanosine(46)-N7)-methyltransferase TrmB [Candidatus Omnitrophica bacterium]|nr:tRNA (guanosine(46)-N7)-methyltransferase TrmB [Candidatus Omnitrophota bacterium]
MPWTNFSKTLVLDSSRPLEVEIGCGKGRFLIDRAGANPGVQFVGIERASKWVRLAQDRGGRRSHENLQIVKGDAREIVSYEIPTSSVARFHIYFPDPWPKRRHRKRRLITEDFLKLLHDRLAKEGWIHFVTDFEDYYTGTRDLALKEPRLWSRVLEGGSGHLSEGREKTHYEARYLAEGRPLYYLHIEKMNKGFVR